MIAGEIADQKVGVGGQLIVDRHAAAHGSDEEKRARWAALAADVAAEVARGILNWRFADSDVQRMNELSRQSSDGALTAAEQDLPTFLGSTVFGDADVEVVAPVPEDVAGFSAFLERYSAGLAIERAAAGAL